MQRIVVEGPVQVFNQLFMQIGLHGVPVNNVPTASLIIVPQVHQHIWLELRSPEAGDVTTPKDAPVSISYGEFNLRFVQGIDIVIVDVVDPTRY